MNEHIMLQLEADKAIDAEIERRRKMQYTITDKGITYYDTEPEPIPDDKAVQVVEEVAAKQRAALECQCEGRKCGNCGK